MLPKFFNLGTLKNISLSYHIKNKVSNLFFPFQFWGNCPNTFVKNVEITYFFIWIIFHRHTLAMKSSNGSVSEFGFIGFVKVLWLWVWGGVKLEFVGNSFDSIRKFAIRLSRKAKNIQKIWWKLIWVWFDSNYRVESNFQKLDLFEIHSIWFEILQFCWFKRWKNIQKIWYKSIRDSFDSIWPHL